MRVNLSNPLRTVFGLHPVEQHRHVTAGFQPADEWGILPHGITVRAIPAGMPPSRRSGAMARRVGGMPASPAPKMGAATTPSRPPNQGSGA